jgi:hypothetical protein
VGVDHRIKVAVSQTILAAFGEFADFVQIVETTCLIDDCLAGRIAVTADCNSALPEPLRASHLCRSIKRRSKECCNTAYAQPSGHFEITIGIAIPLAKPAIHQLVA